MTVVTGTLLKHRRRLNEITTTLARHGLVTWAARGGGIAGLAPIDTLVHRVVSEEDLNASEGGRLRWALAKRGTTAVKFGQMLSLRPRELSTRHERADRPQGTSRPAVRPGRDSYATAVTKPLRRPSRGRKKSACFAVLGGAGSVS